MGQRRRRQRRIDAAVLDEIRALSSRPLSGGAVLRALKAKFPPDVVPSLRTVQDVLIEMRPSDPSGPWSLPDARDSEEARLVPPVIATVVEQTGGERAHVTIAEAELVARIRSAAENLDLWAAFRLARLYLERAHKDPPEQVDDLDAFLAYAPWRSEAAAVKYFNAVDEGWVGPPQVFLSALVSPEYDIPHRTSMSSARWTLHVSPRLIREAIEQAKAAMPVQGEDDD